MNRNSREVQSQKCFCEYVSALKVQIHFLRYVFHKHVRDEKICKNPFSYRTKTKVLIDLCQIEKERSAIKTKLQHLNHMREKRLRNELRARKAITRWLSLCLKDHLSTSQNSRLPVIKLRTENFRLQQRIVNLTLDNRMLKERTNIVDGLLSQINSEAEDESLVLTVATQTSSYCIKEREVEYQADYSQNLNSYDNIFNNLQVDERSSISYRSWSRDAISPERSSSRENIPRNIRPATPFWIPDVIRNAENPILRQLYYIAQWTHEVCVGITYPFLPYPIYST